MLIAYLSWKSITSGNVELMNLQSLYPGAMCYETSGLTL